MRLSLGNGIPNVPIVQYCFRTFLYLLCGRACEQVSMTIAYVDDYSHRAVIAGVPYLIMRALSTHLLIEWSPSTLGYVCLIAPRLMLFVVSLYIGT